MLFAPSMVVSGAVRLTFNVVEMTMVAGEAEQLNWIRPPTFIAACKPALVQLVTTVAA